MFGFTFWSALWLATHIELTGSYSSLEEEIRAILQKLNWILLLCLVLGILFYLISWLVYKEAERPADETQPKSGMSINNLGFYGDDMTENIDDTRM